MFNDTILSRKSFKAMTSEEQIELLHEDTKELFSRFARMNDEMSILKNEINFWRKFYAIQQGLTTEQINQLFNFNTMSGIGRSY